MAQRSATSPRIECRRALGKGLACVGLLPCSSSVIMHEGPTGDPQVSAALSTVRDSVWHRHLLAGQVTWTISLRSTLDVS
eukprot:756902-Amphidinium_carterae.3